MSWMFMSIIDISTAMIVKLGGIILMSPAFVIPGSIIALVAVMCGQLYMRAQLPVKREMSNARAPVLAHFGAAIAGLSIVLSFILCTLHSHTVLASIRAYGAQEAFRAESFKRIDRYSRAARIFHGLQL